MYYANLLNLRAQPHVPIGVVGLLPEVFLAVDGRPAVDQVNDRYHHGGGWRPLRGFQYNPAPTEGEPATLVYEGEETYTEYARWNTTNGDLVILFSHEWVAIIDNQGQFLGASRMD